LRGTTGALEFVFTRPPEKGGAFTVTVRLAAGVKAAQITGKVLVRADGKRMELVPAPVMLPSS